MDFDEVADELYRLPPSEFTDARDRRAKEARAGGDRDLSVRIQGLRRPTASAWLANLLVREQPDEVSQLLDLGQAMREAQQALAGDELLTLSRQRQQVVNALSQQARRRAAQTGYQVGGAAGLELEETLHAALADESAADLLRAGRISTALKPGSGGFGSSSTGIRAEPSRTSARADNAASGRRGIARTKDSNAAELRNRRTRAHDAIRRAEKESREAEHSKTAAEESVRRQAKHNQDVRRRLGELEAEVNRVRAEDSLAQRELRRLQRQLERASKHADEATRRLAQARSQRDGLESSTSHGTGKGG